MRLILILPLVLIGSITFAQKTDTIRIGPVTVKDKVEFRLSGVSLDLARTLPIRLRVDNPAIDQPYDTLVPPRTCNQQGSNVICEAFIPADTVGRLNVAGRHDLFSFTFDGNCCESGPSSPWTITTPKPPVLLRIE